MNQLGMRTRLPLVLCFLICASWCLAVETGPDNDFARTIAQAEAALETGDSDAARILATEARDLARARHDVVQQATACRILTDIWYDQDGEKALVFCIEELDCRTTMGDRVGMAYCHNVSGILLKRTGKHYEALKHYYESLRIAETIPDLHDQLTRVSAAAFNIASLYDTFHFYQKAIQYYQVSLDCEKELDNLDGESLAMANMAVTYRELQQFEKSVSYAEQALAFAEQLGDEEAVVRITNNLGYTYLTKGQTEKARELHEKALQLARAGQIDDMLPYIYSGMGEIDYKMGRYAESLKYQLDALKLCREEDLRMLIYRNLTDVSIALNDIPRSAEYFTRYKELLDRYYSPATFDKFEVLMNAFEDEQKNREIQLLKNEKRIQRLLKNVLLLGLFTVLIFLMWMISRYRMKQRMNRELDNLSRTDPLTGLSNRRDVMEKLGLEHLRSCRNKKPFSICICDIDHFKSVNDTHGHAAGDAVLRQVARTFRSAIRGTDIAGRWGGEEFILAFPETDLAGAMETIEKLRKKIAEDPAVYEDQPIPVTLTFGIARCNPEESLENCINRADTALYKGKEAGRDRVVTA